MQLARWRAPLVQHNIKYQVLYCEGNINGGTENMRVGAREEVRIVGVLLSVEKENNRTQASCWRNPPVRVHLMIYGLDVYSERSNPETGLAI